MEYNSKYDDMPLRGKCSYCGWLVDNNWSDLWGDYSRKYNKKEHKHYNPYKDWWTKDGKWEWRGVAPSAGHRRKTWRDYR